MAYAGITKPSLHFNTVTYTGNGGTQTITGVGFQPDFTWVKGRDHAYYHYLQDVVRGSQKIMYTNNTEAEVTITAGISAWNADGYVTGSQGALNYNGRSFVAWNWKAGNSSGSSNTDGSITSTVSANTTAGFSIVTYTGTGSTTTVGHGLGVKPDLVIYKERNNANSWRVMTDVSGSLKRLYLNVSDAEASIIDSSTAPTSTVLNIGTGSEVNRSSGTFVAYCFASKKGFSKFGSYTGNGNADGTFVYTGFKPAWVLTKETSNTSSWDMHDNKRDPDNVCEKYLLAEDTGAEDTTDILDFCSNGFKFRSSNGDRNQSGASYIYIAFAEEPLVANVGNSIPATAR